VNVAVVSCVYPPEPVVSSRTSADVAEALAASSDRVTVICPFPSRPEGRVYDGFRRRWRQRTAAGAIEIVRCWSLASRRSTLMSRLAENISFGLSSMVVLLRIRALDLVYINSWPVFATAFVALAARLKRARYVISVQDVYPESLMSQNRPAAGALAPLLRRIDAWVARRAAAVIVIAEPFASIYRHDRGVDADRIHVVPNWISEPPAAAPDDVLAYRRERGIADDDFLVVYAGNVGVAAGVEQLIESIPSIHDKKVRLLVAGSGASAESCEELARKMAPDRVQFHRPWLDRETALVLCAADLLALSTAGDQSRFSVPSKLISYFFAERPVIAIVEPGSEIARILHESRTGWTVGPGHTSRLAGVIEEAMRVPAAERAEMGRRAQAYAATHFGKQQAVSRVLSVLRSAYAS